MESQDHDLAKYEAKQEESRRINEEIKEDIVYALTEILCQANKDEISQYDIFECIEKAFFDADNTKIKVEVQNNQVFKIDTNVKPINNYTHLDLEDLPFEQQIVRIFRSEGN